MTNNNQTEVKLDFNNDDKTPQNGDSTEISTRQNEIELAMFGE
jgi:hypothetical protein